ncbi:MAG: hypothetical protein ABIB47_00915 [Candidatus Woesearchaeota archaeon]
MDYKKAGVRIISFFIFLGLFSAAFALTTDLSIENFSEIMFEVIYDNANTTVQNDVTTLLNENCIAINSTTNDTNNNPPIFLQDVCNNATLLNEITENCNNYYELKNTFPEFEPNLEFEEACNQVLGGTLNESCALLQETGIEIEPEEISEICFRYTNKEINNKTFFVETLTSAIPENISEESATLLTLSRTIDLISLSLLGPLIILLFVLLYDNKKELMRIIGNLLFSLGFVMVVPILLLKAYVAVVGYDTTPLLISMQNINAVEQQQGMVAGLVPLVLGNLIGLLFLITGAILFFIGLLIKRVFKKEKTL